MSIICENKLCTDMALHYKTFDRCPYPNEYTITNRLMLMPDIYMYMKGLLCAKMKTSRRALLTSCQRKINVTHITQKHMYAFVYEDNLV